jgi:hypothetical protein
MDKLNRNKHQGPYNEITGGNAMKIYKNPTMEIRSFISESIVTSSSLTPLEEWQVTTGGTVVQKSINANDAKAMKVMGYTF